MKRSQPIDKTTSNNPLPVADFLDSLAEEESFKKIKTTLKNETPFSEAGIKSHLNIKFDSDTQLKSLKFKNGTDGLGLAILLDDGDGSYDVIGNFSKSGRLLSICIQLGDEEEEKIEISKCIGSIGVDTGRILITDPCYVLK